MPRLETGVVLAGTYRILRPLGQGGMAEIYEAEQVPLSRRVAIKVLAGEAARGDEMLERFQREAKIFATLRHANIAQVFGFDRLPDGTPYLVMESLDDGVDLATWLREHGPLPLDKVVDIVHQIASALSAAHGQKVVHRQLSPQNLFLLGPLGDHEVVKILDFGISKVREPTSFLTSAATIIGTPPYMAPEQVLGRIDSVDERTDQYALAAITYELITGQPPFRAEGFAAILLQVLHEQPPPFPHPMPAVEQVVLRGMAKERDARFPSVADFAAALSSAARAAPADPGSVWSPFSPQGSSKPPGPLDDDVQFSVYRPRAIVPGKWYPMLAFAHRSEPRAGEEGQDPLAEVVREAQQSLGEQIDDYQDLKVDSAHAVPREGELTFVPVVPGLVFNPPSRTFRWLESVHKEEFRLKADATLAGETASGRLTVYLGSIILADISLRIHVEQSAQPAQSKPGLERAHARPYRKIFASYSRKDEGIVAEFERYVQTLGDRYLRDCRELRSGEAWSAVLMQLIEESDVFQLFWSTHSMHSRFVRREWEHALSLHRNSFVRPVYWEEPLPATADLPPEELRRLAFQKIVFASRPTTRTPIQCSAMRPRDHRGEVAGRKPKLLGLSARIVLAAIVLLAIGGGLLRWWKPRPERTVAVRPPLVVDASTGPPAPDASMEHP